MRQRVNKRKSESIVKLTNKWYKKLADSGFKDIEWYDETTGKGQNSDYIKRSASRMKHQYKPESFEHYRIMRNFVSHYKFKSNKDRIILEWYADGIRYRKILSKLRRLGGYYAYTTNGNKHRRNISLLTLHRLIKKYVQIAYDWNKADSEGLEYGVTED